jgi:hypothetical protein
MSACRAEHSPADLDSVEFMASADVLDLTEARAKIARAKELHDELATALAQWQQTGGVEAQSRPSSQFMCYFGFVKVNAEPPINLAMRAGETLHALRSALDYTAFQIYLANGGTSDGEKAHTVAFPIVTDPAKFDRVVAGKVPGAWPAAVAELRAVQQFAEPPPDPPPVFGVIPPLLSRLATLGGTDKHRNLTLFATGALAAEGIGPEIQPWFSMQIRIYVPGPVLPITPGQKVEVSLVMLSPKPASHPDEALQWNTGIKFERPVPPTIKFGFRANDDTQIDAGELPEAIDLVESIVERFAELEGP